TSGNATITGCTIVNNKTQVGNSGGGVESQPGSTVTIDRSTIASNTASGGSGGGIESMGLLTLSNSTIRGNTAGDGGGLHTPSPYGSALIQKSRITGNTGQSGAGGILAGSRTTLDGVTVDNNTGTSIEGTSAGGVEADDFFTMFNSTIAQNTASGSGAGVGG